MNVDTIYKRRLPHAYAESHPVFLTWRLKFTLPTQIISEIKARKAEFEETVKALSDEYKAMQAYQFSQKLFYWFDAWIDKYRGCPVNIAETQNAGIIKDAFHFIDNKSYQLHAYCIMPNHVHVLFTINNNDIDKRAALSKITHSLKRHTARELNRLNNNQGTLWARESYDHIIRNQSKFNRTIQYIISNPVKAGLADDWHDWDHTWVEESIKRSL